MTVDREQKRRDAVLKCAADLKQSQQDLAKTTADLVDTLLAELEQAERDGECNRRQRATVLENFDAMKAELEQAEQREAEVVEALRDAIPVVEELIAWIDTNLIGCVEVEQRATQVWHRMKDALEAHEQEQA